MSAAVVVADGARADVADDDVRADADVGDGWTAVKHDRSSRPHSPPYSVPTGARKIRSAEFACGTATTRPMMATDEDNSKFRQRLFGNRGRDGGDGGGD